jgi:hypothetical protein
LLSQVGTYSKKRRGWARVQAICDYVHHHITFGYEYARFTKTAFEAFNERTGVCRDYTHLAVALCRCMNIPARYCTGYLGDIEFHPMAPWILPPGWKFTSVAAGILLILGTSFRESDSTHCPGSRCGRRRHHHDLRTEHSGELHGLGRRSRENVESAHSQS